MLVRPAEALACIESVGYTKQNAALLLYINLKGCNRRAKLEPFSYSLYCMSSLQTDNKEVPLDCILHPVKKPGRLE